VWGVAGPHAAVSDIPLAGRRRVPGRLAETGSSRPSVSGHAGAPHLGIATYCGSARVQVCQRRRQRIGARRRGRTCSSPATPPPSNRAKADGRNCVRILLSDSKSAPAAPGGAIPFHERRDPSQGDRREHRTYEAPQDGCPGTPRAADKTARSPGDHADRGGGVRCAGDARVARETGGPLGAVNRGSTAASRRPTATMHGGTLGRQRGVRSDRRNPSTGGTTCVLETRRKALIVNRVPGSAPRAVAGW
jgi:hypothetical protein